MTPRFAQAVDPIFLYVLDLLDRIHRDEQPIAQEERLHIRGLFEQAEAMLGTGADAELAKYAIVSWIDEMLVDSPWSGREWWSNNVLEVEYFNTRLCFERFYVRTQEATALPRRDALEVFYVCVVLGFRGLYRDPEAAREWIETHHLPPDLASWAKETSMAIRLGQGRPPLARARRELAGASPLRTKSFVVWSWLAVVILAICTTLAFLIGDTSP